MIELLTIREVCAILRIGERTVYELCRAGRLPGAIKVGGQWRVHRERLLNWVEHGGEPGFSGHDGVRGK